MQNMIGRSVRVVGFDLNGERYPISKGTLVGYTANENSGISEIQISHEGMLKVVKISSRMIVEEFPE